MTGPTYTYPFDYACKVADTPGKGGILRSMKAVPTFWARHPDTYYDYPTECTSFMISPHVLLTADHCWSDHAQNPDGPAWARFRSYKYGCGAAPQSTSYYSDSALYECYPVDELGIDSGDTLLLECDDINDYAPGDTYGYLYHLYSSHDAYAGWNVYRIGQNPVYIEHPDWPFVVPGDPCRPGHTEEDCPGVELFCYIYLSGPYYCYYDDTKFYGSILYSTGTVDSVSDKFVYDTPFNQRGFSGGPVIEKSYHNVIASPGHYAYLETGYEYRGFEGCTGQDYPSYDPQYCEGPYHGQTLFKWSYITDQLGDINGNGIIDHVETIENRQLPYRKTYFFDVNFDNWARNSWIARVYGNLNYDWLLGHLMVASNAVADYRPAFYHNNLHALFGKKWRVAFYVYADANVTLYLRQYYDNYTKSRTVSNNLPGGQWQLATMTLDLDIYPFTSIDRIEWGIAGSGNAYVYGFAFVEEAQYTHQFDFFDDRNLWKDYYNDQPAAFTYRTTLLGKKRHSAIVYGGPSESTVYQTLKTRYFGLNYGKNYTIEFAYRTIEDTGANPGFFRLWSQSSSTERCLTSLPNTGGSWVTKTCTALNLGYEDYEIVFTEKGVGKYEVQYVKVY